MFIRDLAPKSILDIMLGSVQVLVYMDWDSFFQQAEEVGIRARWTTRKERKEITEESYQEPAFRKNGHIPVMEKDEAKYLLMGGSVGRLVNEGLSPSCLLDMVQTSLDSRDEFVGDREAED